MSGSPRQVISSDFEQRSPERVQRMFAAVAPRYDLINHLLSFNIDRSWRKALRRSLEPVLARPQARILDLCCGTGDVLLDLQASSASPVMGADFCHPMLVAAARKSRANKMAVPLFEADALRLPLAENALDAISIAFGFRNLADYPAGLTELARVLRPGGVLAILEFSHPQNAVVKGAYGLYSRFLLPAVGGLISGSRAAYEYLPDSIQQFPAAGELQNLMTAAGFSSTRFELLTGGIAALHTGLKSLPGDRAA